LIAIAEVHKDQLDRFSSMSNVALVGTAIGAVIGSMSFSGSVVAFLKLQEVITGRPVTWPFQRAVNAVIAAVVVGLASAVVHGGGGDTNLLIGTALFAVLLGVFVVLPIGGADMPVIISLLQLADRSCSLRRRLRTRQFIADHRWHHRGRFGLPADQDDG